MINFSEKICGTKAYILYLVTYFRK